MLAIPVFRARVAPVLDWCSKIIIIPESGANAAAGRQIDVVEENGFRLMRMLREQGIKTLICGALSPEMLNYGESVGLRIIHGIAGQIDEVLQAYRDKQLDQPIFRLPGYCRQNGCRGRARRASGGKECPSGRRGPVRRGRDPEVSGVRTLDREAAGRAIVFCICPKCGSRTLHDGGIACSRVRCPACCSLMTGE